MRLEINGKKVKDYLKKNNLIKYLQPKLRDQIKPDYCDLARLHKIALQRKVFTILEFGTGWSTIILADALRLNKQKWNRLKKKPETRNLIPFKLFSVDSSKKWIVNAKKILPNELKEFVQFHYSGIEIGKFNGRICHFYDNVPDIIPNLIYLDGPDPKDVQGSINGMSFQCKERTVMSGDLLLMEPTLLPRTFIIIDGRTNNARFLENNLQRNWNIKHNENTDITTMELAEKPLGRVNEETIKYCLGKAKCE